METHKLLLKNSTIWRWILFSFVLAGLTGFLYRLGFVFQLPFELNLANVRQAHSHLMFFGWGSLFPLYFICTLTVPGYHVAASARLMRLSLWIILVFSLLSYPSFILYGYDLARIGGFVLPLSAILSACVMVGWYLFIGSYIRVRCKKHNFKSNIWFEGALLMLVVSSLGAWGVGFVQMSGFGSEFLVKLLPHFFLTTFSEGWVLLALLGLITRVLGIKKSEFIFSPTLLVFLIAVGAAVSFPFGMPQLLSQPFQSLFARIGAVLIAVSVLMFVVSIISTGKAKHSLWMWPLAFLGLKSVMQLSAALMPLNPIITDFGSRILYLHVLFLGAYTNTIALIFARNLFDAEKFIKPIMYSITAVLISLVLPTWFLPTAFKGIWIYSVLAIAAIGPVLSISVLWFKVNERII